MKKILLVLIALVASISFISCKKCIICRYEYIYYTGDTIRKSESNCGNSKENKDFKNSYLSEARLHGVDEITCEDQ